MSRPSAQRSFFKDLQELYRTIETSTDGQASILGIDEMSVKVALQPKSGFNAHAVFYLNVSSSINYNYLKFNGLFYTPLK